MLLSLPIVLLIIAVFQARKAKDFPWWSIFMVATAIALVDAAAGYYVWVCRWVLQYSEFYSVAAGGAAFFALCFVLGTVIGPGVIFNNVRSKKEMLPAAIVALALFICVTYFIGFSLAFWDKKTESKGVGRIFYSPEGLYHPTTEEASSEYSLEEEIAPEGEFGRVRNVGEDAVDREGCYLLKSHEARVFADSRELSTLGLKPDADGLSRQGEVGVFYLWLKTSEYKLAINSRFSTGIAKGGFDGRAVVEEELAEALSSHSFQGMPAENVEAFHLGLINGCSLLEIVSRIRSLGARQPIEVRIESYVTNDPVSNTDVFSNNSGLAQFRANTTYNELHDLLFRSIKNGGGVGVRSENASPRWPDISWRTIPEPTEPRQIFLCQLQPLDELSRSLARFCEDKPSSLVKLAPVRISVGVIPGSHSRREGNRKLKLMDYMYFSIYTITTTGYGDITPVSPFSRGMVSLANLFEVFFVVIFINILLGGERPAPGVGSTPAGGSNANTD